MKKNLSIRTGRRKSKSASQQLRQPQQSESIIRTDIKGRPLTSEEGCGYSKIASTRIVGGVAAKNGISQTISSLNVSASKIYK